MKINNLNNKCEICGGVMAAIVLNDLDLFQCKKCGLVCRREFSGIQQYYEEKPLVMSKTKEEQRRRNSLERLSIICKVVGMPKHIFDIGTGEGTFILVAKEAGVKDVSGIEPGANACLQARNVGLDVIQGGISDVCKVISNRRQQVLTMFHVIEHLEHPKTALSDLYTCMKPGSFLMIETPNFKSYSLQKTNYRHELVYPEHLFYFDRKNLRRLLENIGFSIVADGKRDFCSRNMSLHEIAFRLGFGSHTFSKREVVENIGEADKILSEGKTQKSFIVYIKHPIKYMLSTIVGLLGRRDYMWVIAQKPEAR